MYIFQPHMTQHLNAWGVPRIPFPVCVLMTSGRPRSLKLIGWHSGTRFSWLRPCRRAESCPPPSKWAWVISPGSRASVGDDFHQSSTKVQYLCYNLDLNQMSLTMYGTYWGIDEHDQAVERCSLITAVQMHCIQLQQLQQLHVFSASWWEHDQLITHIKHLGQKQKHLYQDQRGIKTGVTPVASRKYFGFSLSVSWLPSALDLGQDLLGLCQDGRDKSRSCSTSEAVPSDQIF